MAETDPAVATAIAVAVAIGKKNDNQVVEQSRSDTAKPVEDKLRSLGWKGQLRITMVRMKITLTCRS